MSNLYSGSEYKNKIINLLLKNEDFIKLINPTPNECEELDIIDVLLGGEWIIDGEKIEEQGHVFDYNFVDDTTTEEKVFCFVETTIDKVRDNTFTDFDLFICVFCPKRMVKLTKNSIPNPTQVKEMGYFASTYANRIDVLCDIVDKTLNGTNKIPGIGSVTPASRGYVTTYCPNTKYYGKCLRYSVTNLNSGGDECGS